MTSNTGTIFVFPRIQPFGSDHFSSLGKVYSRQATDSVNCENSSVSFVMKYCPTSTVVRNPASVQNCTTRFVVKVFPLVLGTFAINLLVQELQSKVYFLSSMSLLARTMGQIVLLEIFLQIQTQSVASAICSCSLSLIHHMMSLNIDMKIIRPWHYSGSPIMFMNFWTSWTSCNVVNPRKIFHSNSNGSPSYVSKVLYCDELFEPTQLLFPKSI